jgi:hypothetical protein
MEACVVLTLDEEEVEPSGSLRQLLLRWLRLVGEDLSLIAEALKNPSFVSSYSLLAGNGRGRCGGVLTAPLLSARLLNDADIARVGPAHGGILDQHVVNTDTDQEISKHPHLKIRKNEVELNALSALAGSAAAARSAATRIAGLHKNTRLDGGSSERIVHNKTRGIDKDGVGEQVGNLIAREPSECGLGHNRWIESCAQGGYARRLNTNLEPASDTRLGLG